MSARSPMTGIERSKAERAREEDAARAKVRKRVEWAGAAGITEAEVNGRLDWPTGAGAALRDLADRGEVHEREGRWYLGPPTIMESPTCSAFQAPKLQDLILRELGGGTKTPIVLGMCISSAPIDRVVAETQRMLEQGLLERVGDRVRRTRATPDSTPARAAASNGAGGAAPVPPAEPATTTASAPISDAASAPEESDRAPTSVKRAPKRARQSTARRGARRDRGPDSTSVRLADLVAAFASAGPVPAGATAQPHQRSLQRDYERAESLAQRAVNDWLEHLRPTVARRLSGHDRIALQEAFRAVAVNAIRGPG